MSHRALNPEELAKLEKWRGLASYVIDYYDMDATATTPQLLDRVHAQWRESKEAKIAATDFACAFGTLIGDYLCERLEFEWAIISDEQGQDFCIRASNGHEAYPIAYVWKRVKPDADDEDPEMFEGLWEMFADEVPARPAPLDQAT